MLQVLVLCPFMKDRQRGEEDSSFLFSPVKIRDSDTGIGGEGLGSGFD